MINKSIDDVRSYIQDVKDAIALLDKAFKEIESEQKVRLRRELRAKLRLKPCEYSDINDIPLNILIKINNLINKGC
jgi:hypothetical protein